MREKQNNKKNGLYKEKYQERSKIIKYSLNFSGIAVAFIITAKTNLDVHVDSQNLRIILLFWGITIFSGYLAYILSYREVYYHHLLPIGLRRKIFPILEILLLYITMIVQPIAMLISIGITAFHIWKAFP